MKQTCVFQVEHDFLMESRRDFLFFSSVSSNAWAMSPMKTTATSVLFSSKLMSSLAFFSGLDFLVFSAGLLDCLLSTSFAIEVTSSAVSERGLF